VPTVAETAAPTASASASSSTAADTPAPVVTDVSRANDFAARVFAQSASGAKGNIFVSPPSVRLAFDVVYAGASGKTKDEMAQALAFDPDAAASLSAAKLELAGWIAPKKGAELTFATRLWVEKTEPVGAPFQDRVKAAFGSGLDAIDFKGQPDPSRAAINAWVKKETKDKIVDLLPKGSVTPLTRLVVTNAVYFLGTWQAPFDAKATKSLDFTLADGKKKSVPTMQKTTSFPYVEDGDLKVAALPYGDGSLRMVVLLGPPGASTEATEKRLSSATFKSLHDKLDASSSPVAVSLPKFEIRWGGSFTSVMKALGVQRAFTDEAELDEIGKDLKITDVFHKTYVKVDEKGTEAAASTGVVIGVKSMPLEQKTFAVDHPFVFYIEDARSGRVLFVGKVADPTGG
jgi:serpin B